jgi:hypothetical protein
LCPPGRSPPEADAATNLHQPRPPQGASTDLRRKGGVPREDAAAALRSQPDQVASSPQALLATGPAADGLTATAPAGGGGGSAGILSVEYSAEADLVRRQTQTLLALLAQPPDARDGSRSFKVPPRRRPGAAAAADGPAAAAPGAGIVPAAAAAVTPVALAAPPAASPSKSSAKGTFSFTALTVSALGGGMLGSSKSLGGASSPQISSAPASSTPSKGPGSGAAAGKAGGGRGSEGGAGKAAADKAAADKAVMNGDDLEAARDLLNIQVGAGRTVAAYGMPGSSTRRTLALACV